MMTGLFMKNESVQKAYIIYIYWHRGLNQVKSEAFYDNISELSTTSIADSPLTTGVTASFSTQSC